jgi:NAD(P)H dehydrogenase (quinone)
MSIDILFAFQGEFQMSTGKILITGATGDTGGAAIERLLELGREVRALAHNRDERSERLRGRGVEVVYGDLLDFGQVRAALDGVKRAYFVYPIRPGILQATAYFAQAAKEAGVDGIVNMSQKSAREDAKSHAATDHWLSERVFDWSGLNVAHIRPTYFAEWLIYVAPMIRAGLLHVPFGTGKHAPITAEDQGRVIAGILEDPARHKGAIYPLYGPVEYTYEETAAVLSRVLGKPVEYKQVPFDAFLAMMKSVRQGPAEGASSKNMYGELGGKPESAGDSFTVQHLKEVAIDHQNGIFAGTNDLVEKLGGRPPMTLEAFIEKHRAAFE